MDGLKDSRSEIAVQLQPTGATRGVTNRIAVQKSRSSCNFMCPSC